MQTAKIDEAGIEIRGFRTYRNPNCPKEDAELITFINWVRREYPQFHVHHLKNEGKRSYLQIQDEKKKGSLIKGAPDIMIPGFPTLYIEMKRQDHTLSETTSAQIEYMKKAQAVGCWCCYALGWEAAKGFFNQWFNENYTDF